MPMRGADWIASAACEIYGMLWLDWGHSAARSLAAPKFGRTSSRFDRN